MARRKPSAAFATRVIHAGQEPDPTTGAVMTPVYFTSTYRQPELGSGWPYDYARAVNPTRSALERSIAALEGGRRGLGFASGMAAIHAVLCLLDNGQHVIASRKIYGGTFRLFEQLLRRQGLEFDWVDTTDAAAVSRAVRPNTRMLFVETPTNPTLELTDLKKMARIAEGRRCRLVVDNTFMTPRFQRPLELGADIVVHSTTKYLNGHSDSIGGAVVAKSGRDGEKLAAIQKNVGAILSPMDSFLILRGIKTLDLRMERHERSARKIAAWLDARPEVGRVHYPGLREHPQHRLARRQMGGFGGMISFDLGRLSRAKRFVKRLRIGTLAESLGGVETLVAHPATMTHGAMSPEEREAIGVTPSLLRISVGIEDADDLIADLEHGLSGLPAV